MALWHRGICHFGGQNFVHSLRIVDCQVSHDGVPLCEQGLQEHKMFASPDSGPGYAAIVWAYVQIDSMHVDLNFHTQCLREEEL